MLINADSLYEYIDGLKYALSLSMHYSKNFKNFVLECGQEGRLDKCLKAGDKMLKAMEEAKDAKEHNFRYYLSTIYPSEQKFLVSQALRRIGYDCSEYDNRRHEAIKAVLDSIDSYYKDNTTRDDVDALARRLEWWLHNFKKNYKTYASPFKTEAITKQ